MANEYLVNSVDLTAVADAIRAKGGTTEALEFPSGFVSAVQAIQAGGGGGNADVFGNNTPAPNWGNMFYALTSGSAKTGSFIITTMTAEEQPIIETGLSKINGLLLYNTQWTGTAGTNRTVFAFGFFADDGTQLYAVQYSEKQEVSAGFLGSTSGSFSISDGTLNVAPLSWAINNSNFWPFIPAQEYKWLAW